MNYLIVGGNAAGMSAASRLRRNLPDANITVLEKGNLVSFGACGLPYFVGGEFEDSTEMIARSFEAFQASNINVLLHHKATQLNLENKTVTALKQDGSEEVFNYDKLLISTGASPIMPSLPGQNLKGVHTLSRMEDGIILKKAIASANNIVIVGGGFIGLETAEAALHHGKNVTLIEMETHLNSKALDNEISIELENAVKNSGVNLRLNEKLTSIVGDDHVKSITTDKGSYPADLVILALGFRPETEWCKGQLEMLPNGAIIIDNSCHTNVKDVFSAGDCATITHAVTKKPHYIPLATGANKLGRLLGDIMAGKEGVSFQGSLGSAGLRFMNFEAGRTGLSASEAKLYNYDFAEHSITDFTHTSYTPGRTKLLIKLIYDKKTRVLLGGQICGEKSAVLRVDALAVAIFKQLTVDELGMMDFIYSPPFARTWEAMNIAGNTAK
ncbi:MAG: CoA-disulfide reductase [Brevinema sp.]